MVRLTLLVIVTPVRRKRNILSASAEDTEGEYEIDDTGSTVQASRQDVVVFDEPVRSVSPEIELGEESNGIVHEEGAVGSVRQSSKSSADDGRVPVIEAEFGVKLVDDPERNRSGATDHESYGHPLVSTSEAEQILCESSPSYGCTVVTLKHWGLVRLPSLLSARRCLLTLT